MKVMICNRHIPNYAIGHTQNVVNKMNFDLEAKGYCSIAFLKLRLLRVWHT